MVIETIKDAQHIISINGDPYIVNIKEFEAFLKQCEQFMSVDDNGFETMVQIISDSLIDGAAPGTTIDELRPQLKFLREVGFLLKNFASPVLNQH
ncbi:hypothetical protein BDE36_1023 [Arcticibacter tournemirensis]|uniref:Uncharacterized protein n=1 Tax=Arcticibacter tournemirensis TaxID=699437 RepID=A0A4Q0M9L6_9SPHI|nr:hypothetical protein [Arcticibacter tournemirensis]KAA8486779.1 hypothetical protein F1649_00780 [Arcticibacter tournemirensis]RXF69446.1 hypothetical protein EKH83_12255 [Arcticibacter tournemirensis]TQM49322.1 hypothetical protein BDE36_1023 [Arcticibacter tournemirensis]